VTGAPYLEARNIASGLFIRFRGRISPQELAYTMRLSTHAIEPGRIMVKSEK